MQLEFDSKQWSFSFFTMLAESVQYTDPSMSLLSREITAYEGMQRELEIDYFGKWALVHDESLIGTFDSFEAAAEHAVPNFGRGPYLIRQIGSPPITLPASVTYQTFHTNADSR